MSDQHSNWWHKFVSGMPPLNKISKDFETSSQTFSEKVADLRSRIKKFKEQVESETKAFYKKKKKLLRRDPARPW
jgi:hypothetical protein